MSRACASMSHRQVHTYRGHWRASKLVPKLYHGKISHLKGDDTQICLLGACLLMTHEPSQHVIVRTPEASSHSTSSRC